jgi:ATPase subunit of ABC transporter with duplicated ATPase domains
MSSKWLLRLTNASVAPAIRRLANATTNAAALPARLKDVSLALESKSHLAILGRNATGKRTLCSMLIGEPGTQLVEGKLEVSSECAQPKDIGTISFKHTIDFLRTHGTTRVSEVLGGLNNSQDLLVRFGLSKLWYRRVRSLSTGETRKVS